MKRAEKPYANLKDYNSFSNARNFMLQEISIQNGFINPTLFCNTTHNLLTSLQTIFLSRVQAETRHHQSNLFTQLTEAKAAAIKEGPETSSDSPAATTQEPTNSPHATDLVLLRQIPSLILLKELVPSARCWRSSAQTGETAEQDSSPAEVQARYETLSKPLGLG